MKIVTLCREGSCCSVVKLTDEYVEIGEKNNVCMLTKIEWEILKEKIINKEVQEQRPETVETRSLKASSSQAKPGLMRLEEKRLCFTKVLDEYKKLGNKNELTVLFRPKREGCPHQK